MSAFTAALFLRYVSQVKALAPQCASHLQAGASAQELSALQAAIAGVPPELLDVLKLHNGDDPWGASPTVLPDMALMGVQDIVEQFTDCMNHPGVPVDPQDCDLLGAVKPIFQHPSRVPFATSNGDVSWLIDLDPAEGGAVGQIVEEDLEFSRLHVVAASLDALFTQLLADLDDGKLCVDEWGQLSYATGHD